jgi:hypothetical protein
VGRNMIDIFGLAYTAAQAAIGSEQWERVSDTERMRAIHEQIRRMDMRKMESRPLVEECPA